MDVDAMIGARLAIGFPGVAATPELAAHLRQTQAQSLVVFSRNFTSAAQFTRLLRELDAAVGRPLLVMVDHEGGRIIRFCEGVTRFPSALEAGRAQDAAGIERQGRTEAEELRRLGVHVNLAPCVDVLVEGSDPVIGDRSYGADAARVAALGAARIRGLQAHGVAACAKHFPGLGAVGRDPHKTLPTIPLDWPAMEAGHLPPFAAAIQAGVATVMSSHVCYPGLGEPAGLPATFSPRLIRDLLRARLGFGGAILTDDLEMGALGMFGSMGEVAVRATEAGHDLLLICSDLAAQKEALSGLRAAYRSGRLDEAGLAASVERVAALRRKYLPAAL
jgi:beta-N-acetylhexosaminidase